MNNAETTLNRVLNALGMKSNAINVDLAQKKTEDGTIVLDSENFAIGEPVFIVTEEGNIPLPAGEYILEDGSMIAVDDMGIIIEIGTKSGEETEVEIESQNEPMKEQIEESMGGQMPKKIVKTKSEMEEQFFSHIKSLEARLAKIEMANVKLSEENEELKNAMANEPAPHAKFNPEANAETKIQFKIGANREETIQDRVFKQLFS
jgi:hypothetical protein